MVLSRMVPIVVDNRIRIPMSALSDRARARIQACFTHANPHAAVMRRIGRGWAEPAYISTWTVEGGCLSLPRGGLDRVRGALRAELQRWKIDDQRAVGTLPRDIPSHKLALDPHQEEMLEAAVPKEQGIIRCGTGGGKCLGVGERVLMFDGTIRKVEDVAVGDFLMGADSRPRRVRATTRGVGPLYRIKPLRGQAWVCNDVHVLTLVHTTTGETVDVDVQTYLGWSKTLKHLYKQFGVGVDFAPCEPGDLDPYFLGVWYGDGTKDLESVGVSKPDPEILACLGDVAREYGLKVNSGKPDPKRCPTHRLTSGNKGPHGRNKLLTKLREIYGDGERLPREYLVGSRDRRLQFLAGLLDTDGYLHNGSYEITQVRLKWAEDIAFLARSLGFRVSETMKFVDGVAYARLNINGEVSTIPLRIPRKKARPRRINKNASRTGFSIEPIGVGEYAGFELDGDGRFLLWDFTVTHNTTALLALAARLDVPTLVLVHQKSLLRQWRARAAIELGVPIDDIGQIGGGKCLITPLTVGIVKSVTKAIADNPEFTGYWGALFVDELHLFASRTLFAVVDEIPARYRIGTSADDRRKDQKEFLIHDLFGVVLSDHPYSLLVERGVIVPVAARAIVTDFVAPWYGVPDDEDEEDEREVDFTRLCQEMCKDDARNDLVLDHAAREHAAGGTIVMLAHHRDHVRRLAAGLASRGIRSGTLVGDDDRIFEQTKAALVDGSLRAAVGTYQAASTGIDVPRLDAIFCVTPVTSNEQLFAQIRGRACRKVRGGAASSKAGARIYVMIDKKVYPSHLANIRRWNGSVELWDGERWNDSKRR